MTDTALPALSIRSIAVSPLDSNQIYAGTGTSSNYFSKGDPGFGVARSRDGGTNWTVEATSTFKGAAIVSIVPTNTSGVVLAATGTQFSLANARGLFRSTDDAKTFTQVSGGRSSGLPSNNVSDIAADPTAKNRYYLAIPDIFTQYGFKGAGVWKSEDDGATWTQTSTSLAVAGSGVIRLSVSKYDGTIFALLIGTDRTYLGTSYSTNQGKTWKKMDVPAATIFPGKQGGSNGAVIADPKVPGIVFISGDYHPQTNGCTDFGGNILRGDISKPAGKQWTDIVCDGANGTSPHADSRSFAFDTTGTVLLHSTDGGLFRLKEPNTSARVWSSFNGDIRPSEMHNIAYDPVSHIILSGNQDTGSSYQLAYNSITWTDISGGDGGFVAVDADQTAHAGTSIRYEEYTNLKAFTRHTFGSNNVETGQTLLGLNIVAGEGSGQTILDFDKSRQFNNPFVLNNDDPSRMLVGTSSLYESSDMGDTFTNLGTLGGAVSSMSYGSALDGTPFPDAFYVGAGSSVFHRVYAGNAPTILNTYPGANPLSLVMNPLDYQNVYVLDTAGSVWESIDEGATWTDRTGDLAFRVAQPQTIEIFSAPVGKGNVNDDKLRIMVGGIGDVVHLTPKIGSTSWVSVGRGLPHAFFYDLHYNAACDVLSVGTLGRGAWTIESPFADGTTADCPAFVPSDNKGEPSPITGPGEDFRQRSLAASTGSTTFRNVPVAAPQKAN